MNKTLVPELAFTVTDVTENQEYEFQVSAENAEGVGAPADTLGPIKAKDAYDVPGQPGKPKVEEITAETAKVTWSPPRDDGGSPIVNYLLEMKKPSDTKWSSVNADFTIPSPEHTVPGLKAETDYMFRVTAYNKAGPGKPSEPSDVAKYETPVKIIRELTDNQVKKIPDTVTFEAELNKPNVEVQWFKNGQPISPSPKYKIEAKGKIHRLTVNDVNSEDDADYTMKVKDTDLKTTAAIFVEVPPKFMLDKKFEDTIIMKVKTSKVIEVPFVASPMPKITWAFNDGKFSDEKRVTVETIRGMTALTISRAERQDAGDYTLKIENKFGTISMTVHVKVLDKPTPVRNLAPDEITPESVHLTWKEPEDNGGSDITGYIIERRDANRQSYNKIGQVKTLDYLATKLVEGNQYVFQVIAENEVGQSDGVETKSITAKYGFDKPGPPEAPTVSDIFKTSAVVNWQPPANDGGAPILGYHLERRLTSSSRWTKINDKIVKELTFKDNDLKEGMEYMYRVMAENKAGVGPPSEPSKPFTAKDPWDKPGPPGIPSFSEITDTSVRVTWSPPEDDGGSPITNYNLEYMAVDGKKWAPASIDKMADTSLVVKRLKKDQEYLFRVCAENKVGTGPFSQNKEPIKIVAPLVGTAPKLEAGLDDVTVVVPNEAKLDCDIAGGDPVPEIKWFKNNKELTASDKYKMSYKNKTAALIIKDSKPEDAATYRCTASNIIAHVETQANVIVHMHPNIEFDKKYKEPQSLKAEKTFTVPVKVTGIPTPKVTWSLNDKPLEPSKRVTLESKENLYYTISVKQLTRQDAGIYTVSAENVVGRKHAEFELKVLDKPSPPRDLKVTDVQRESISVAWQPSEDDGGSPITSYILEKRDAKKTSWTNAGKVKPKDLEFQIAKLIEGNEYFIRVIAENEIGQSEPCELKEPVKAKSPFDVPGPPIKFHVTDVSKSQISLAWEPPLSDGGTPIKGYIIERKSKTSQRWVKMNKTLVPELAFTVTDVTENQEYEFQVSAENAEGVGAPADTLGPIKAKDAYDVPGQPGKPKVEEITAETAKVTWSPPRDDGGSPIVNYLLEMKKPSDTKWSAVNADFTIPLPEHTVPGLKAETDYMFRVTAYNKAGPGKPSEPSDVAKYETPVKIIRELTDNQVKKIPDTVTFEAELNKPNVEVQWFKNGQSISPSPKYKIEAKGKIHRLTVNDVNSEDDADYTMKVKDTDLKTTAAIFVEVPPKFMLDKKFEDTIIMKVKTSKVIEVPFVASPMPKITWAFNDGKFSDEKRVTVETIRGMTALTISRAERQDAGDYTLKIENKFGTISMTVHVKVLDKPTPVRNLAPDEITPESVHLTWKEPEDNGGSDITGYIIERRDANRQSYNKIGQVKTLDYLATKLVEGNQYVFQVIAENEVGQSDGVETKSITAKYGFDKPGPPEAPTISDIFKTSAVVNWQPPANDGGAPILGYHLERRLTSSSRWTKINDKIIKELTFKDDDLKEGMEYMYRVMAENKAGVGPPSEPSKPFTAKDPWDRPGPPGIPSFSEITDTSVRVTWSPPEDDGGSPITNYNLEYMAVDGKKWAPASIDKMTDTSLVVKRLKKDQEYLFRVCAENKVGTGPFSQNKEPIKIVAPLVGTAPKLEAGLDDVTVVVPNEAKLDCDIAGGDPVAEIKWFKNNKELTASDKYKMSYKNKTAALIIKDSKPEDAATYRCTASNIIANVQTQANVIVHMHPNIEFDKKYKEPQSLKAEKTFTVPVKVTGIPTPKVTWSLNDKPLEPSKRVTLESKENLYHTITVKQLTRQDAGIYTVSAENVVGRKHAEFELKVLDKPSPPRDLKVTDVQRESISVAWQPSEDDGGSPITSYILEKRDAKKTSWSNAGKVKPKDLEFQIAKLIEGNEYFIRVIAENEIGQSEPCELKEPVKAKSPFDVPGPPIKFHVTDVSKSQISLAWEPPLSDGGTPIKGYIIERKSRTSQRWVKMNKTLIPELAFTVTDVTENQEYEFQVSAENAEGVGAPADTLGPIKAKNAYDVPGQPGKPKVKEITAETAKVTWSPPRDDGGSPIVNYLLEMKKPSDTKWSSVNADFKIPLPEHTVPGLKAETDYMFRVTAYNKAGPGKPSEPSDVAKYETPVKIIRELNDNNIKKIPDTVTFEAELNKPNVEVQWFKNDQPISPSPKYKIEAKGNIHRLTVNDVNAEDDADYTMKVKDTDLKTTAAIFVEVPPKFMLDKKFEDTIIMKVKTSKVIEVPFVASPMPKITWAFNDGKFSDEKRVTVETIRGMTALTISRAERQDAGDYALKIENKFGTISMTVHVKVLDKPTPVRNLAPDEITPESVHLTWKEPEDNGGSDITGYIIERRDANRQSYNKIGQVKTLEYLVTKLVEGNQYVCRVIAENEVGQSDGVETKSITAKYGFDKPGPPEAPTVSDIFKTSAVVNWQPPANDGGAPILGYHLERRLTSSSRWTKINDKIIKELTFKDDDLKEGMEYMYRVMAENKAGVGPPSEPSKPFTAKDPWDKPGPPGIPSFSEITDTSVRVTWSPPEDDGGSPITNYNLEYKAVDGKKWAPASIDKMADTSLVVKRLKKDQEYLFRVCAENKVGTGPFSQNKEPIKIVAPLVGTAPKLEAGLDDVTVVVPNEAKLDCDIAGGDPVPEIKWFKNNKELTASDKYKMSYKNKTAALIIKDSKPEDAATYRCTASNIIAHVETQANVIIHMHPNIEFDKKYKEPQSLKAEKTFTVPVKVTGIPTPKVTWSLNDKPLEPSKRVTLESKENLYHTITVKQLTRQDAGIYTVSAENVVGRKHAEFELKVLDKPSPPRDLKVTDVERESISVAWQPSEDDGGSPITSYILEKRDAKKTSWSNAGKVKPKDLKFQITKLIEGNEYFIRVIAENEIGQSEPCELKEPVKAKSPFGT
ncbi:titin-like [Lineus longissimus]|uniref:titin-like n=1 Tax=Lineus longissimus TaxID=88925 RepID=UPI00315C520F